MLTLFHPQSYSFPSKYFHFLFPLFCNVLPDLCLPGSLKLFRCQLTCYVLAKFTAQPMTLLINSGLFFFIISHHFWNDLINLLSCLMSIILMWLKVPWRQEYLNCTFKIQRSLPSVCMRKGRCGKNWKTKTVSSELLE